MPESQPAHQHSPFGVDGGAPVRHGRGERAVLPAPSISPFQEPDLPPFDDSDIDE